MSHDSGANGGTILPTRQVTIEPQDSQVQQGMQDYPTAVSAAVARVAFQSGHWCQDGCAGTIPAACQLNQLPLAWESRGALQPL